MEKLFLIKIILLCLAGFCKANNDPPVQLISSAVFNNSFNGPPIPQVSRRGRSCSGVIWLTEGHSLVRSPQWPNNYPDNYDFTTCYYSPTNTRMRFSCKKMDIEYHASCYWDNLYLSPSGDLEFKDELRFCGARLFAPVVSSSNFFPIGFHSDGVVSKGGYDCVISVVPIIRPSKNCLHSLSLGAGQRILIVSPNTPFSYPNNFDGVTCISSPPQTKMELSCNKFDIEYQEDCLWDKLYLSRSGDLEFKDETKFCGSYIPNQVSQSNFFPIGFHSDASEQRSGYNCNITVVDQSYVPLKSTSGDCECGVRNSVQRIINGTETRPGEFPWRCFLSTDFFPIFCGCTIISNNWILTARHCTKGVEGMTIYVTVGVHDRSHSEKSQLTIKVDKIVDHPYYDARTVDNDISLLHLSTTLSFDSDIAPSCLPWHLINKDFADTTATTSGWGATASGGSAPSNELMFVDLPILTTEQCRPFFGASITDNMICSYLSGKDACQGDSGGSIDYLDPGRNRYYSIGVISWGIGCARENYPGVYAKVTNYLNWIETNTEGDFFCKS